MSAVFPDKKSTGKPNGRGGVFNKLSPQQPIAVTQDEVMPRMLDPQEMEWKKQISESLLELMDLSLIATIPEKDARSRYVACPRSCSMRPPHPLAARSASRSFAVSKMM